MDAKITKQRIGRMLSYDWLKIVGIIVAAIIVWSIIFTTTATRVMPTQQMTIFSYHCNTVLSESYYNRQEGLLKGGLFSYEVIELHTYDLSVQKDMSQMMMQTRLSTNEGDLMFVPNAPDVELKVTEDGETTYPRTYLESAVAMYPYNFFDVEEYLQGMDEFLDEQYGGDHKTGTLDEDKVKQAFLDRVKAKKDKRFKTAAQRQDGAEKEVERIRKYKTAYDEFTGYLDAGVVSLQYVEVKNPDGTVVLNESTGQPERAGNFAVNLCPDVSKMGKLREWYSYYDETAATPSITAQNMCVLFLDMYDVDDTFEYESLVYVTHLIKSGYTA